MSRTVAIMAMTVVVVLPSRARRCAWACAVCGVRQPQSHLTSLLTKCFDLEPDSEVGFAVTLGGGPIPGGLRALGDVGDAITVTTANDCNQRDDRGGWDGYARQKVRQPQAA